MSGMLRLLAPVAALLTSVAILLLGGGLQGTLLPLRAQLEGFSTVSVGLLAASYFCGFTAGCFLGPRLVASVGHVRSYAAMTAIAASAVLCHVLIVAPLPWWLMRAAIGFSFAVLYLVIESWLNERATNESRGVVLAAYLIINLLVMAVGQFLVLLYDLERTELFILASLLLSIAAVPVALSLTAAPDPPRSVRVDVAELYRVSPAGSVACVAIGLVNGAFWGLGPVFASAGTFDVATVAVFMATTVLGGALGQWPLGRVSDRNDRRKVMLGAALAAAACGTALALLPREPLGVWLAVTALWGAASFPLYALAVAHANDCATPERFVEVASGLLLLVGLGAIMGPVLAGLLMQASDVRGLYVFTSTIHVSLAIYLAQRIRVRASDTIPEHIPFSEALEAAQTVSPVLKSQIQARRG
jgi:MFS family permease